MNGNRWRDGKMVLRWAASALSKELSGMKHYDICLHIGYT